MSICGFLLNIKSLCTLISLFLHSLLVQPVHERPESSLVSPEFSSELLSLKFLQKEAVMDGDLSKSQKPEGNGLWKENAQAWGN